MSEQDIEVKLDNRVRLLSAVLSVTDFPDKAQKAKPHGTHAHARATRKICTDLDQHPAVLATQKLLDQGTPIEALFALVTMMKWPHMEIDALPPWAPESYNETLFDFYLKADLESWWEEESDLWEQSLQEAKNIYEGVQFKHFLEPFLGKVKENFIFVPNISYPTDYDVGFKIGNELMCISPPPLAWGDSPPWPYDESSMRTYTTRAAMTVISRILLKDYLGAHADELAEIIKTKEMPVGEQFKEQYPTWEEQFSALFLSGTVAMYLESHEDEAEFKAYMLMEKKARGMAMLPGTVSVLRRYLQEVGNTKYTNLMEFLPYFPKQLRVAKKIVTF